jgi:hypothetical protein
VPQDILDHLLVASFAAEARPTNGVIACALPGANPGGFLIGPNKIIENQRNNC